MLKKMTKKCKSYQVSSLYIIRHQLILSVFFYISSHSALTTLFLKSLILRTYLLISFLSFNSYAFYRNITLKNSTFVNMLCETLCKQFLSEVFYKLKSE